MDKKLIGVSECARRLSVSRTWLYEACKEGKVPHVRLGGEDGPLRFDPDELDAWIEAQRAGWKPSAATLSAA